MTSIKNYLTLPIVAGLFLMGGAVAGYASVASAQGAGDQSQSGFFHRGGEGRGAGKSLPGQGVHGTIASISGTTLTIIGKDGTTYTVDANGAEVRVFVEGQGPTDGSLADLAVGDKVGVRGEVSGTNVVAEVIREGGQHRGKHGKRPGLPGQGIVGEVSGVSGSTITITARNGTVYTIDASGAEVKQQVVGSLSDIAVGDRIGVHGEVSGTSVSAKHIIDDLPERPQE